MYKHQHHVPRRKAHSVLSALSRDAITRLSLLLNILLAMALLLVGIRLNKTESSSCLQSNPQNFHGGHPEGTMSGTCWCGSVDKYCMCTPSLAIDLVISSGDNDYIWLVRRKDTNQLATMGGFVNVGETVEHAVRRELQEEMGIILPKDEKLKLLGIYSDPRRDNRRHTVSAVFVVNVPSDSQPRAADDVKDVQRIRLNEIEQHDYFADHKTILDDFRRSLGRDTQQNSPVKDVFDNVVRSTCHDTTS